MAGEGSSSHSSKLPPKRPFAYLESEPLPLDFSDCWDATELDLPPEPSGLDVSDNLVTPELDNHNPMAIPQVPPHGTVVDQPDPEQELAVASPPVHEDLPGRKHKKTKKEIDKKYRDKQKAKKQKMENNLEELMMERAKMEVRLEDSKAQIAMILAAFESSKSDLAKVEKNLAHMKGAMALLHKLNIEEDVSCNTGKEELWEQICNPNGGMQIFEKYWDKNEKSNRAFRTIADMLLHLPQE